MEAQPSSNDYTVPNCLWCQPRPKKMKAEVGGTTEEELLITHYGALRIPQVWGRRADEGDLHTAWLPP